MHGEEQGADKERSEVGEIGKGRIMNGSWHYAGTADPGVGVWFEVRAGGELSCELGVICGVRPDLLNARSQQSSHIIIILSCSVRLAT